MLKLKPLQLIKRVQFPQIEPVPVSKEKRTENMIKRAFRFLITRRSFEVVQDHICWSEYLQAYIFTPMGFIYDGASIPKVLNNIYSPTGVLFYGACPHDFGYRYGGLMLVDVEHLTIYFKQMTKKEIDDVFNDLCCAESGMKKASLFATKILTIVGIPTWKKWRKESRSSFIDFPKIYV